MKVYIVLDSFNNGGIRMDKDDGYGERDDKFRACFREFDRAWTYLCMLIEHECQWFKGVYNRHPNNYNEPCTTFAESDSEHSAEVHLEHRCGKKMQYSAQIVEVEI